MREVLLAVLLAAACASVTVGAAFLRSEAGWVVGGVLGAVWALVVFAETKPRVSP
jgi:hypothetical protein